MNIAKRLLAVILTSTSIIIAYPRPTDLENSISYTVTATIDGLNYTIVDGKAEVNSGTPGEDGLLTIPSSIDVEGTTYKVEKIGEKAFYGNSAITQLIISEGVTEIGDDAFYECRNITGSLIIPESVKIIGSAAFYRCDGFTGCLKLPSSVKAIGRAAFVLCSFTGTLHIPDSLTIIEEGAFDECRTFTGSLIIPDSVTEVEKHAFYFCKGLADTLTIGRNVQRIWSDAFNNSGFSTIISLSTIPPDIHFDLSNPSSAHPFFGLYRSELYVPDESLDLYKEDVGWRVFNSINPLSNLGNISATGIALSHSEIELMVGASLSLTATIVPTETTDKTIIWSSSEEEYATVDASGLVTAVKPGTATITATTSTGLTAKCEITVIAATIDATGLTLNIEEAEMIEGNTLHLIATVAPDNALDKTIKWVSSDISVATVDVNGFVSAIKVGKATITATCGELTATCEVTVTVRQTAIDGVDSDLQDTVRVEGNSIVAPEGSVVYDLNGRRVKATNLAKGIYIVRTPDGKSVKVRL